MNNEVFRRDEIWFVAKEAPSGVSGNEAVQILYLLRGAADRTSVFYGIQKAD